MNSKVTLSIILMFVLSMGGMQYAIAFTYTEEDAYCHNTTIPFPDSPCACADNGVDTDSCKAAVIDPNDPTSILTAACYYEEDVDCTYAPEPCGIVVSTTGADCFEEGNHVFNKEHPEKPPCGGSETGCSDTNGGFWPDYGS